LEHPQQRSVRPCGRHAAAHACVARKLAQGSRSSPTTRHQRTTRKLDVRCEPKRIHTQWPLETCQSTLLRHAKRAPHAPSGQRMQWYGSLHEIVVGAKFESWPTGPADPPHTPARNRHTDTFHTRHSTAKV
jgi:hypothetical protein